ncbi:Chitinase 4 [Basidiobolus ranarum]|uniref:Chitinase 4 n=1 Tax=Basidiobolus ranarum TaxID=34480 RepID=A0ABR2VPV7_9FUNG
MNCADIEIQGSTNGYITGPKLLVVNLSGYPTIPEFSQDGPNDGRDLLAARPIITIRPEQDTSTPTTTTSTTPTKTPSTTTTTSSTATPTSGTGACKDAPAWSSGIAYNGAQKVTHKGHLWQAKWWTQNESPDTSSVWTDLGAC